MFYGTSYAYDLGVICMIPLLVSLGFLIRFGVVCLADLAVKNTTFKRRLLVMVNDDIIIN